MAGKYFTVLNPGYSTLLTRDLPYLAGVGDVAGTNPLDPNDARALVEGEWLELAASSGAPRFTRGGDNVVSVSGTIDDEELTDPSFPYFQEKGRYDAQSTKLCHCLMGPAFFEFRTKLVDSTGMSVNSAVTVWDWDGQSGAYGIARRVLGLRASGYTIGRVSRIYGTDDIAVIFGMQ